MRLIILLILFSINSLVAFASDLDEQSCRKLEKLLLDIRGRNPIEQLKNRKLPVIMAHGKNQNIARESTWLNIIYSIFKSSRWSGGLEVDVMMTRDGKLIMTHDPTFHRLAKDYETSWEMKRWFHEESPEIARLKSEWDWDYNLFDEVHFYTEKEIKDKFRLFDPESGIETPFISLDELLSAFRNSNRFKLSPYDARIVDSPRSSKAFEISHNYSYSGLDLPLLTPMVIYIDFKPINNYARRLYGLSDWHWIRNTWDEEKLRFFTELSIHSLSNYLKDASAHQSTYIAVRHPEIASMVKRIDSDITIMASPETIYKETSAADFIQLFEEFEQFHPDFIEIKYLNHMLNPVIRDWANRKKYKIMYNHIIQGDTSQFEGTYANDQKKLMKEITELGTNIIIQTNNVKEVKQFLKELF